MSVETETTPKKTFLTRAMEAVRDEENQEVTEEGTAPKFKFDRKKVTVALGAVAGTAAVLTVAIKLFTGQPVEEEISEESTPED